MRNSHFYLKKTQKKFENISNMCIFASQTDKKQTTTKLNNLKQKHYDKTRI